MYNLKLTEGELIELNYLLSIFSDNKELVFLNLLEKVRKLKLEIAED